MGLWGSGGNGQPIKIQNIEKVRAVQCDSITRKTSEALHLISLPVPSCVPSRGGCGGLRLGCGWLAWGKGSELCSQAAVGFAGMPVPL